MSNNLRQIAKDLRSFVKRCKDVHYSDSLLISFLITGLLTIAPKLHADVASEQQEITAQTYDAITDLRQSFMRARKENEKSLKGAQSELVQLLKQGDQVIKSPWASFQFGTGYINNDWGTTYRGRGGKFLEYFRRNNDLTKYVFDANKHLYGATNLNMPRNQEPNSLVINPANIHEPYVPYEITKMDTLTFFNAPSFNPQLLDAPEGYYAYTRPNPNPYRAFNELGYWTTTRKATHNYSRRSDISGTYDNNSNANVSSASATGATASGGTASTVSYAPGAFAHVNARTGHTSNASYDNVSGSLSFDTVNSHSYSSNNGVIGSGHLSENITVQDEIGAYYSGTTGGTVTSGRVRTGEIGIFNAGSGTVNNTGTITVDNGNTTGIKVTGTGTVTGGIVSLSTSSGGVGVDYQNASGNVANMDINVNGTGQSGINAGVAISNSRLNGVKINLNSDSSIGINSTAAVDSQATIQNTSNISNAFGIKSSGAVKNSGTIDLNSNGNVTGIDGTVVTNAGTIKITGHSNGSNNVGAHGSSSATNDSGHSITVTGYYHNAGLIAPTVTNNGTISVTGSYGDGIYADTNHATSSGSNSSITVTGSYNDGVKGAQNANLLSSSTVTMQSGNYNNGVHAVGGNASVTGNSRINLYANRYSNGVYAPNGDTTVTSSSIYVGEYGSANDTNNSSNSNGINLVKSGATNSITSSLIYMKGNSNIGVRVAEPGTLTFTNNHMYMNGSGNYGLYLAPSKSITSISGNSTTSDGSSNVGIFISEDAKITTISGGSHTVNGTTSTGIDIHTTKDTTISGTTFNVNNYSSTGIRAGRTYPNTDTTPSLTIENSTFNILNNSGNGSTNDSNSASAVYLYNVTKTTVKPTTTFNINRNSIGFEVENSGYANREIEFTGQNNSSYVIMNLRNSQNNNTSGQRDGNIGFNIINGNFGTLHTTRGINVHGNFDSHIESDENVLFNNQQYASKLEFVVGAGATTMDARNYTGQGTILVGTDPAYNAGRKSGYNKNVIFSNLGWVSDTGSKVDLNHISVDGNYNTVAFFNRSIKNSHGYVDSNNAYHPTGLGRVGWFEGTVRLQGVIGSSFYESTNAITSTGNVGVYAISGQRGENTTTGFDGVRTGWIGAGMSGFGGTDKALKNLNVTDLNLGFSRYSEGGVLVYAGNGTAVDVANVSSANNLNATNTISDGVFHDTGGNLLKWGYSVPIRNTSHNTTMFFAKGTWKGDNHGFLPATYGNTENAPTEINVKSAVDMVSRQGTAYRAKGGATINVGTTTTPVATRAGGYNSIIALAEGIGTDRNSKLISERTGTAGNNSETGSRVEINGNIVAADNAMFSETSRVMNGREDFNTKRANTYENVAAYASGGGDVVIQKTAVSNTVVEDKSKTGANINKDTEAAGAGSLIYGMGAYATGEGSNVIYKSGVSVVSGENGALFATDKGYIEFQGNIVNQNNTKDTIQTSANGFSGAETRKGKNTATSASSNDHTDTTPFYVLRNAIETGRNSTAITFTDTTRLDMYDGRLLTGNEYQHAFGWKDYSGAYSDYYKEKSIPAAGGLEENKYWAAKYRGMNNVKAHILSNNVDLGIVNQAEGDKKLTWDNSRNDTGAGFLTGIAKYAGEMSGISNYDDAETDQRINDKHSFKTTLINGEIDVTAGTVDLTDNFRLQTKTMISTAVKDKANDPFTDIAMESEKVNISAATTIYGNAKNLAGQKQGLNMANSLFRWDSDDLRMNNFTGARYRRSKVDESGYWNKGNINIWGGSASDAITAVNVAYGTVENAAAAKIYTDHGNAIVGTDGSKLVNKGKIAVTGIYNPDKQVTLTGGSNTGLATIDRTVETAITDGENYGIVGISTANARDNAKYRAEQGTDRYGENAIAIENVASGTDGTIAVDGKRAVGIYAQNTHNDSNTVGANKTKVTIKYDNMQATPASADAIKVNSGQNVGGIDTTAVADKKEYRGVGIALVNRSTNADNDANRGGVITLNTLGKAANPDIRTQHNGIGVYAEGSDIVFGALSEGLTVNTKNDGAGIWVTDNSNISSAEDRLGTQIKALNYNYKGDNDKKGFGMIFGSTLSSNKVARNYLDIKFNNNNGTMDLATAKALEARGFAGIAAGPTYKGIAGILVNTDAHNGVTGDRAINYGDIKEQNSTTNVRSYGAVVNKGGFENWGNITLSDSLNELAKNIKTEDLKKANIGILANDHSANARYNTFIENHGDITIGDSTNDKNIGSWAIYGYNITTGAKADGTKSKITVNKNNNGIYSGDGNVNIQQTKILVGNDTVMGHVQHSWDELNPDGTVKATHLISRQTQYANPNNLLSALDAPRKRDSVIGVYIDNNQSKSNAARDVNISADMDIDRFSYGIVMAEKNGGAATNVTIGSPTEAPTIRLAHSTSNNAGGQVKSVRPSNNPKVPKEVEEQGNAVYYYSLDTASAGKTYANVTMNGDYNTAYYTKGSIDNYGTIDLRSKYDVDNKNSDARGFGNIGIFSSNTNVASTNYGTITTGMSDTINMRYSAAMAAGRNTYYEDGSFAGTKEEGYIVNRGTINVEEKEGIGMFATGHGSKALNYGTINLKGEESIGMYLDRGAIGENHGTIKGNARNLSGVVAINGGYIKNYGTIKVEGNGSHGIVTDGRRFTVDANGNRTEILPETATNGVTAGQVNGHGGTDLYGGNESSIEEGTTGNPKTTGVGTTITAPDIVPITKVSVDGIDTPIFNVESDVANPGDWAKNITVSSSIQTGGTRIIDLSAKNEWGNPVWEHAHREQQSEVTSIGMYVDTSGVRYTNPIDGIENLPKLSKVDLYFGPEATLYTNSKAIRIGDKIDENGNVVAKSNILKPFNDALNKLPGGAKINPLSASLTWQVLAKISDDNQLSEVYMSKVPYHSFAYDNDTSLVNFTNNLDNIYEIAKQESAEKIIFNKLNSLGNGEGHILAQAFDQMRGHIYGGVQQRIKATSDVLGGEINGLRNDRNVSKDSNKFKAFGQRNEFKTDTAGMPDWYSNAGGVAFVHEDETVRLGQASGWSAGIVNNYYTFKDLSKSYENQAMAKVGVFKSIPLDGDGTFVLNVGGDGFFGRNDMKRRFWVVDQEFRAKSSYYTYGAGLNAGLEKSFVINDGFSIVPNVGIKAEYGRFSTIHEKGNMALKVKSDDYISVKPSAGIDFRYSQEVFKNSNLTASLGFTYENEIGKLYDVENEARIIGAWTDYFGIRGDKEDKRGNFKSDLKLGLDNGRFGFNVNTGYDTKGHNFRAGLGLKVLY